ncbi:uncharacterized protein FIBRA_03986 [Fibroporia radiculosa]|uniref:Decapping nuclease n=1 Tax=Fibroporia radiculosa TaxID=599839 RepID=J4GNV1_9APHY|nr:uncharacterized protein FIBRA_03986 [Fibroporia radiculosa]CCM01915.1 predicted protein [Fibroporia radiculosa]
MTNKRDLSALDPPVDTERQGKRRHVTADSSDRKLELAFPSTSQTSQSKPVPFQQPVSLITFSYTPSRKLEFNNSALRYYVNPPRNANLRHGYERWIKRPEEKGRIDGLLRATSKLRNDMNAGASKGVDWIRSIGVVSWRGVMTKILTAPYEDRDSWEMNVMAIDGTMYFEEHLSDAKLVEKEDMAPHHRLQSYYGYSFESWCGSSKPEMPENLEGQPPGWGGDVDTNVQWCSVVKTKLGDTRMVIGGEVDCVRNAFTGQTSDFVELKTSIAIRGPQDEARFEKKLLKFYFQSFLLGVPEIIVGFRTPSGQLNTIQLFKTAQIPRMVRGKPNAWDPTTCFAWGQQFFAFLKSVIHPSAEPIAEQQGNVTSALRPQVWRVKFEPRVGVSVSLLGDAGVSEIQAGEDRVGFLPRWYWDEVQTYSGQISVTTQAFDPTHGKGEAPGTSSAQGMSREWQI